MKVAWPGRTGGGAQRGGDAAVAVRRRALGRWLAGGLWRGLGPAVAGGAAAALLAPPAVAAGPAGPAIRGVTEETAHTYLRGGQVAGPASEVVQATLQRAGFTGYTLSLYPWARAYDLALAEPNVLIFLIARTPEREARFQWVGELLRMDFHLYRLRDRAEVQVRQLDDARRWRIGVLRDDVRHQFLKAQGFDRLVVAGQPAEIFQRLLAGQVDLVPLPEVDAAALCRQAGLPASTLERVHRLEGLSHSLQMAYSLATPLEVVERTRRAFAELKAEGQVQRTMSQVR